MLKKVFGCKFTLSVVYFRDVEIQSSKDTEQ